MRILNAILYASDGLILVMAMHYTFLTRKVPASVNETTTVAPGNYLYFFIVCSLCVFVFVCVAECVMRRMYIEFGE